MRTVWTYVIMGWAVVWGSFAYSQSYTLEDSLHADEILDSLRYYEFRDPDIGLEWCDSLERFSREHYFKVGGLRSENRRGRIHASRGEYQPARKAFEEGIRISQSIPRPSAVAAMLDQLGTLERKIGRYPRALEAHLRAYEIYDSLDIQNGVAVCNNNLAIIYKIMDEDSLALVHYQLAADANLKGGRLESYIVTILNLSYVHIKHKDADSSLYYQNLALGLAEEKGLMVRQAQVLSALYDTYMLLDRKKDAQQAIEKADRLFGQTEDRFSQAGIKVKRSHFYIQQKQYGKAEPLLAEAQEMAEELGALEIQKTIRFLQFRVNNLQNRYKKALDAYMKFTELKDSLTGRDTQREIEQLRLQSEVREKEAELAKQESELARMDAELKVESMERRSQELELGRVRNRLWLLLVAVAFLLLGVAFFLTKYFDNRRRNRLLEEKQAVTEQSLRDKELLMSELHHRVKNNLQLIYNLLDLQSRQVEGPARTALDESKGRVTSMALIHQELYQEENVSGVDLQKYLRQLTEGVDRSFGLQGVDIQLAVDPIWVDLQTSVPLGLVVNELVTNSLKHGFPGDREGWIKVGLEVEGEVLVLVVADNGVGQTGEKGKGFGKTLIRSLSRQMKAEVLEQSGEGMRTELRIRKFHLIKHA